MRPSRGIASQYVRDVAQDHLRKSSEMKNGVNNQLERGFGVNTIAEKLGWLWEKENG